MQHAIKERPPPKIVVSEADYNRLTGLAEAALERVPAAAGLLAGMDRAVVTTPGKLPADVVRMGSTVTLEGHEGPQQIVLVYPAEADIAAGRFSVLTSLGAALRTLIRRPPVPSSASLPRRRDITALRICPSEASRSMKSSTMPP